MAIPLPTSTVTVRRSAADATADPYYGDVVAAVAVASGVPAHISTSRGQEDQAGGTRQIVAFRMSCDQFEGGLHHDDTVLDEQSGEVYEVVWSVARNALGLDHFQAGLRQISGVV